VFVASNRPQSPGEIGLSLVVQGKASLEDLADSMGIARPPLEQVVLTSPVWDEGVEETQEVGSPVLALGVAELDEDSTEASGPRMLPDLLGEEAPARGSAPAEPRLLLVLGKDGLDDRVRRALPSTAYRVASVADVAAARDFIHRTAPRAILLSVGGDVPGSVAQIVVLREDLASAFLPLVTVGAEGDDASALVRAGADETLAAGLSGPALASELRAAIRRAT
jgi:hypothetical protein